MSRRLTSPVGHGEVLVDPPFESWASLAGAAHDVERDDLTIGGVGFEAARDVARREALAVAEQYCERLGIPARRTPETAGPVLVTGHQPELYHPGVWVKVFLAQRFAETVGGTAIDLVVDTDVYEAVALRAPCLQPEVSVCSRPLALGDGHTCFFQTPVPDEGERLRFREEGGHALSTLDASAPYRHFVRFCDCLDEAARGVDNLAELVTRARRRYESEAGTDYLELPVSGLCGTPSFRRYAADIVLRADTFASSYNGELAAYRKAHRTRSVAQPFPDLRVGSDGTELPFWAIRGAGRRAVRAVREGGHVSVLTDDGEVVGGGSDVEAIAASLGASTWLIAPRAVTLTLYTRLLLADLFVHGVGGGRYDRITDGVARGYYGVDIPRYAVASMTMYLPHGMPLVTEADVKDAESRLHRLKHNPDEVIGEIEWDTTDERDEALALVEEKGACVKEISEPGADRKRIGLRIKAINERLLVLLDEERVAVEEVIVRLRSELESSAILTDRTYPFCLWSPTEIRDKVS